MSLKVTNVLKRFRFSDVSVWLKQVHLAKDLLKMNDLAVDIFLFLDGTAFAAVHSNCFVQTFRGIKFENCLK